MPALEVKDLNTSFRTDDGIVKAVSGVSFSLEREGRSASSASPGRGRASPS